MTDYTKLVKALRCCDEYALCNDCPIFETCDGDVDKAMAIAAAAIEELQAEVNSVIADAGARIGKAEAEVKRLKECNDELREAQTYIDHYGDKWMTSAKDVPTSAYNHGYMDGKSEAEQALEPKRGKWVEDTTTYAGPGLSNYKCSLCGKICGTWRRGLKPSELPNWCGNCGADMRAKMEVQE